jgi:uncharacterized protein YbjT (DUF2867 family)
MKQPAEHSTPIIVVLGATGQQGGAVARALIATGRWHVRALARDPASESARRLADLGIDIVPGNLDQPDSLRAAFAGAHGVYSIQATNRGQQTEIRQGITVVDAAVAAGISHFIYASVGGAERNSGVPHFESKWAIEQHLSRSGLPATVVRPTFFMENFSKLSLRVVLIALMQRYMAEDKSLQMIAIDDIGTWVARAFADPESFIGKSAEIAGDELTRAQVLAVFKTHVWFSRVPIPSLLLRRLPGDVLKMFDWFGREGYHADIPVLRKHQPGLLTLEQWIQRRKN